MVAQLTRDCTGVVAILAILFTSPTEGINDLAFSLPSVGQSFMAGIAGSQGVLQIDFTISSPTIDFTQIDLYLLGAGTYSVAETITKNQPVTSLLRGYNWSIPDRVEGQFWVGATKTVIVNGVPKLYLVGYAPANPNGWQGASLNPSIDISRFYCNATDARGHDDCASDQYCDIEGRCFACSYCATALDPYNGYCPAKCGGATGYTVGDRVPNVTEAEAAGAIRDVISTSCPRYNKLVINSNSNVFYVNDALGESNRMSVRLSTKIDSLATALRGAASSLGISQSQVVLVVHRAYRFPPTSASEAALFNEGRAALISYPPQATGTAATLSELMRYAIGSGFDWVHYASESYLQVSVTPDSCNAPLDLMFLLDGSGSIEASQYGGSPGTFSNKVLGFVQAVVPYFSIGSTANATQVGVGTFSDEVDMRIYLDNFTNSTELIDAIGQIPYPRGFTFTSDGLYAVRTDMMQDSRGLRPLSSGVNRVLILVTDGASTETYEPAAEAELIRQENVNVFAMGVGQNVNIDELNSIASSPRNVFLLKSFSRIFDVVASISSRACDAPAVLTAGEQVAASVAECEVKYFRPSCTVSPGSILQITVTETTASSSLHVFASTTSSHPGPFDYEYQNVSTNPVKTILVPYTGGSTYVTVAIKGVAPSSSFTLDIWSDIFQGTSSSSVSVSESIAPGSIVFTPPLSFSNDQASTTPGVTSTASPPAVRLVNGTGSGLNGRVEVFVAGSWGTVCDDGWDDIDAARVCSELGMTGGFATRRASFGEGTASIHLKDVNCSGNEASLLMCPASSVSANDCAHSEDAGVVCSEVASAATSSGSILDTSLFTYSIQSGGSNLFEIDPSNGVVSVGTSGLDFEASASHTLRIAGSHSDLPCFSGFIDLRVSVINVNDNAPVFGILPSAVSLSEDAPPGTTVIQLTATDADGSVITYAITSISRRRSGSLFVIDSSTGVITTAAGATFDAQSESSYTISASASDSVHTSTVSFTVQVQTVACSAGTWSSDGSYPCVPHSSTCAPPLFEVAPPSVTADRECAPCAAVARAHPFGCAEHIDIPDGTTQIGSDAFRDCVCLRSVNIPWSVTNIGPNAFRNAVRLEQVVIPPTTSTVGARAFKGCSALDSVCIPSSVLLDATAFSSGLGCTSSSYVAGAEFCDCVTSCPICAATNSPSALPTDLPTDAPSDTPSLAPTTSTVTTTTATTTTTTVTTTTATTITTLSPTREPSARPTFSPTTRSPTVSPTSAPSNRPTHTPTNMPTAGPTHSPTYSPTHLPTHSPTDEPTNSPTNYPTEFPTETPTEMPTWMPSSSPTAKPTALPTNTPTVAPTNTPTYMPSPAPTSSPTDQPSRVPTAVPSATPTDTPTAAPTFAPSAVPTSDPTTLAPTDVPTVLPSRAPTFHPCTTGHDCDPATTFCEDLGLGSYRCSCLLGYENTGSTTSCTLTASPTAVPTDSPTATPSVVPTDFPTVSPSARPTGVPSSVPTYSPTVMPTDSPTDSPTNAPTGAPTDTPTDMPSSVPTYRPTLSPTSAPSTTPTTAPTWVPTSTPSFMPTADPTYTPTYEPSFSPTGVPTAIPSATPTDVPTAAPTEGPTVMPSAVPTSAPTTSTTTTITTSTVTTTTSTVTTSTLTTTTSTFTSVTYTTLTVTSMTTVAPTAAPVTSAPTMPPTTLSPTYAPVLEPTISPSSAPVSTLVPTPAPVGIEPEITEQSTEESSSASTTGTLLALIVVAVVAAIAMVAMFVKRARNMKHDQIDLVENNPLYLDSKSHTFGLGAATGATMGVAAALPGAALAKRRNWMWINFRRCIAFDHMHYGNKLLALGDAALQDVYAVLGITCPVAVKHFPKLREVGQAFCEQTVQQDMPEDDKERVLADTIDFIDRAMADVLMEEAIDYIASRGSDNDDEDFYQCINDYVPEENIYLSPAGSGRGLRLDAAERMLKQIDPDYEEPDELISHAESDYAAVCQYALAGDEYESMHVDPAIYDTANCHGDTVYGNADPLYDTAAGHGNSDDTAAIYDTASTAVYSSAGMCQDDDDNDDIYGLATGNEGNGEGLQDGLVYGMASTDVVYDTAGITSIDMGHSAAIYDAATDDTEDGAKDAIYDNPSVPAEADAVYDNAPGVAWNPLAYEFGSLTDNDLQRSPSYTEANTSYDAGPSGSPSYNLATESGNVSSYTTTSTDIESTYTTDVATDTITSADLATMANDFADIEKDLGVNQAFLESEMDESTSIDKDDGGYLSVSEKIQ